MQVAENLYGQRPPEESIYQQRQLQRERRAQRMMEKAAVEPLPTTVSEAHGADRREYKGTWVPTGYIPSTTQLSARREYLAWRADLEATATKEVKATHQQYRKERARDQKEKGPKVDGRPWSPSPNIAAPLW